MAAQKKKAKKAPAKKAPAKKAPAKKAPAKKAPARRGKGPTRATLWAYDVGFGDCILLELGYAADTRFVLFDFGTKGAAKKKAVAASAGPMLKIAQDIAARVRAANRGRLVAVVATHRHQDHISGFAPGAKKAGPGSIIESLKPDVVVQPWTDTPGAAAKWGGPGATRATNEALAVGSGGDPLALAPGTLQLVHEFAGLAIEEAHAASTRFSRVAVNGILSVAGNNLPNQDALDLLKGLCPAGKHDYVYAGSRAKNLERVLPGVQIKVLGPPTLHQYTQAFKGYAKNVPDEYWSLRARLSDEHAFWQQLTGLQALSVRSAGARGKAPFPGALKTPPPEARWVVQRLAQDRGDSVFEVVRAADNVLNNTSVMLLLTIGNKRLLFPGDAQYESWNYALEIAKDGAATKRELAQTDLYKVGHHGSLNATPKRSVWGAFSKRGAARKPKRLTTVLSTATGYFGGKNGRDTEVPRKPLVKALKAESNYHSTNERRAKDIFVKVDIPL